MFTKKRHFLVQEVDGHYQLREIEAAIAQGINHLGNITGKYHRIESLGWTFYFMNCKLPPAEVDAIASQLTQTLLRTEVEL